MKNNKIKIESFISDEALLKLEAFESEHGLTKAEIMRRALTFWLSYVGNLFPSFEKAGNELNDINKILNLSDSRLQNFAAALFDIARNTQQPFESVRLASQEFAKQGLNLEETLDRTKNALILSKLSGVEVGQSVNALTSALNDFNSKTMNSSNVVSKLVLVDANFAVSSKDLCEAVERVGDKAGQTMICFDRLISLISALQSTTNKGGTIIGDALKSIFSRLDSPDIIEKLQKLNIAINNDSGALEKLQIIASELESLPPKPSSEIIELIGGLYRISTTKAMLSSLSDKNSVYHQALNLLQSISPLSVPVEH